MTFNKGWRFAELHMPNVRSELGELPMKHFIDIETAIAKRDMEEATDLVITTSGVDIAVRIRRNKFYKKASIFGYDLSIRAVNKGYKTEIDKLIGGFGDYYFYGYSDDDNGTIAACCVIDINKMRQCGILEREYPIYPNGDGTSGMYIPITEIRNEGCIIHEKDLDTDKDWTNKRSKTP